MEHTAEKWVRDGRATALPTEFSDEFEAFLNRQARLGSSLDWSKMPLAEVLNAARATPEEVQAWAGKDGDWQP
jgi:hypothetical protein